MALKKCPTCGFSYLPYDSQEQRRHRDFHHGVPADPAHLREPIWQAETTPDVAFPEYPPDCVTIVTPMSPASRRKRAGRVALFANMETRYTGGVYNHTEPPDPRRARHLFLYASQGFFIGLAIFDRRRWVIDLSWDEYDRCESAEWKPTPPIWAVSFLWVHRNHRRRGIATRLVSVAAEYVRTPIDRLGLSPPLSPSAAALARALAPVGPRLVCEVD